jgi:acylphosphatase
VKSGRASVLAHVTGRVQGVSYRAWARSKATKLGLTGWVRNNPDGSVTALLVGPEQSVSEMIKALWKGPPAASVSDVSIEETDTAEQPAGFTIAR